MLPEQVLGLSAQVASREHPRVPTLGLLMSQAFGVGALLTHEEERTGTRDRSLDADAHAEDH